MSLPLTCILLVLALMLFSGVVALFMDGMGARRRNQGRNGFRPWMRFLK